MGKTRLVPKGLTTALGFYGLKDDSAKAAKELSKAVLSHYHASGVTGAKPCTIRRAGKEPRTKLKCTLKRESHNPTIQRCVQRGKPQTHMQALCTPTKIKKKRMQSCGGHDSVSTHTHAPAPKSSEKHTLLEPSALSTLALTAGHSKWR